MGEWVGDADGGTFVAAIEQGGDIVAAGSMEPYDIYLWSLRTGQLLDVLSSHEGPISGLCFSPPSA